MYASTDQTTSLVGDRPGAPKKSGGYLHTVAGVFAAVAVVALVGLAIFRVGIFGGGAAEHTSGFRYGQPVGSKIRYIVKTRCISDATKASNPGFFRDGTTIESAMIVRHNLNSPSFFNAYEASMMMTPVTRELTGWEWDWEAGRFFVDTDELDWEWGFALVNNFGEVFYEIGSGPGAPLWGKTCPDVNRFDSPTAQYHNRLMTKEANATSQQIEYVFGDCESECPERNFIDWAEEDKAAETASTKADPPDVLGAEFIMYGLAGNGVCGMDLYASGNGGVANPSTGDIVMHFLPLDYSNNLVIDSRQNMAFASQQMEPWVFGPRGDTSSTYQWMMRCKLEEDHIDIRVCSSWSDDSTCEPYTTYNYRSGAGGYSLIDGILVHAGRDLNLIKGHDCGFYSRRPGPQKNVNF